MQIYYRPGLEVTLSCSSKFDHVPCSLLALENSKTCSILPGTFTLFVTSEKLHVDYIREPIPQNRLIKKSTKGPEFSNIFIFDINTQNNQDDDLKYLEEDFLSCKKDCFQSHARNTISVRLPLWVLITYNPYTFVLVIVFPLLMI